MKHCCTPKTQDNCVFHGFSEDPCIGVSFTQENIFPFTQGNNISTQRNTRGLVLELLLNPPQTAHEGGESPTPFPNLSLRVLKCPFRVLSPCPIQILAGALYSALLMAARKAAAGLMNLS